MADKDEPEIDGPAIFARWQRENLARMNPFVRYLYDNGLFDDVIRPEISATDVFVEPRDHCSDAGCEHCIGHEKGDGWCTHECHKNFKTIEVPFDHCSYFGHANCPGTVKQGANASHCTCAHHRSVQ